MFAVFGTIVFQVLGSPERMESTRRYDYAVHRVVEAQPLLQWVGDPLESITLEMMLHASFTNPIVQLAEFEAAAADHQARALVFGSGEFRGYFVITSLAVTARQLGADGTPIAIQARLGLTEWTPAGALDPNAAPVPLFTPLAVIASPAPQAASGASSAAASPLLAGLSAVLNNAMSAGAPGVQLTPDDIPPSQIVRSAGA